MGEVTIHMNRPSRKGKYWKSMDTSQFGRVQGTYEVGPWYEPVPASGIQHWLPAAQALSLGRVEMWGQKIDRALLLGRVPQFLIFTIIGESPFPTQRSK